jgi:hypothetical protein
MGDPSASSGQGRPDALMLRGVLRKGSRGVDRVYSIAAIAEPLLGVDRRSRERAYIRQQPHNWLFVSLNPRDTIKFPRGHELDGQPRYRWVVMEEEICEFGYLVEGAEETVYLASLPVPAKRPTWREVPGQL